MNFVDKKIEAYAQSHSQPLSQQVNAIHQWTEDNTDEATMLSGPLQASVLQMLTLAVDAKRVLEIGMFTGYSALAMAEVLPDSGELITLDILPEREAIARSFFDDSPHGTKIEIVIGNALDTLTRLAGPFDLVYIDADKTNYIQYYEAVMPLLRTGGLIVADNVLWSATVLNPDSEDSTALDQFNKRVCADRRVANALLTVRDGLMVARKIQ